MAWFTQRAGDSARGRLEREQTVAAVVGLATMRFELLGETVAVDPATRGDTPALVGSNGARYQLGELIGRVLAADPEDLYDLVVEHVNAVAGAAPEPRLAPAPPSAFVQSRASEPEQEHEREQEPDPEQDQQPEPEPEPELELEPAPEPEPVPFAAPTPAPPSEADFLDSLRLRILPESVVAALGASYAPTIWGGLRVLLGADHPTSIETLDDAALQGRDPNPLLAPALAATMAEPVDLVDQAAPGVWRIVGESPFTAAKVLGMGQLIGTVLPAAPHGVLFGTPHRHVIYAHPVTGSDSVAAVGDLTTLITGNSGDDAPGGAISGSIFYWRDGAVDVVGTRAADGRMHIDGSGRFGQRLQQLMSQA